MTEPTHSFYDALADHYHLIFEDWDSTIERQKRILGPLLTSLTSGLPLKILDCACGIGTQALGLAAMGHRVFASDVSQAAVKRAQDEAGRRGLDICFRVSDMTSLREITEDDFDVVAAFDNALPHLGHEELRWAAAAMASKLKPNGLLIASLRDYDRLIVERPCMQQPAFYGAKGGRRIIHQVWDWISGSRYVLHLYITSQSDHGWDTQHFVAEYRCLLRKELSDVLREAGLTEVRWLMPSESGFYQPILLAGTAASGL